jgi:hypothetical protein
MNAPTVFAKVTRTPTVTAKNPPGFFADFAFAVPARRAGRRVN